MPTWEDLRNTTVESGWKMLSSAAQSFSTPIAKSLANIGALGATGWGAIQMARNKPESAQKAFDKALAARQYAGTEGSFDQGFKSGGKTLLQGALSSGQTALTGLGLPHLTAGKLATAGVIGGGFNKVMGGDFSTGAGQAMGSLPQILGFVAQSNPVLAKYLPKSSGITDRILGSVGNVTQGIGMDLARGMPITPTSIGIDAITGLSGTAQFDMPKTKLNPDVWTSDKSILNEAKQKLRVGIDISENTALTKNLDNMYKQYGLASYPGWKNLTDGEKVDILDNRLTEMVKEFSSVKMGIVGDQPIKTPDVSTPEVKGVIPEGKGKIYYRGVRKVDSAKWGEDALAGATTLGESHWTTDPEIARRYAGKDGKVYQVPSNEVKTLYTRNERLPGEGQKVYENPVIKWEGKTPNMKEVSPSTPEVKTGGDFNIKSFINNKLPKQLSNKLSLISTNRQKVFADSIKVVDIYEDIARQKLTGQKKYDAIDNVLKEFSKNQSNRTKDWVQMILDKQGADKVIAFDNFINRIHEGGGNILSYDLNDFVSLNEDQTILDDFANYIKKRLDDLAK